MAGDDSKDGGSPDGLRSKVRTLRPVEPVSTADPQSHVDGAGQAPDGQIRVVVTHLEMLKPPPFGARPHLALKLALMRAERPTVSFYRYLYHTVGQQWLWYERRVMDDASLERAIQDPSAEIFVLYVGGVPAGFFELDTSVASEVELKYFGLLPDFIGQRLGGYMLEKALERAWSKEPARVWLNTCTLDHPKAMAVYQRAGFVPFKQEVRFIDDPVASGAMD